MDIKMEKGKVDKKTDKKIDGKMVKLKS